MLRRGRSCTFMRAIRSRNVQLPAALVIGIPTPSRDHPPTAPLVTSSTTRIPASAPELKPLEFTLQVFGNAGRIWPTPLTDTWLSLTLDNRLDITSFLWELECLVSDAAPPLADDESERPPSGVWESLRSAMGWSDPTPTHSSPVGEAFRKMPPPSLRSQVSLQTGDVVSAFQHQPLATAISELCTGVGGGTLRCSWEDELHISINGAMVHACSGSFSSAVALLEGCLEVLNAHDVSGRGSLCQLLLFVCKAGVRDYAGALDALRRLCCKDGRGQAKFTNQLAWGPQPTVQVPSLPAYAELLLGRVLLVLDQPHEAASVLSALEVGAGSPVHTATRIFLARAQARAGDPHAALTTLNGICEISTPMGGMGGGSFGGLITQLGEGLVRVGPVEVLSHQLEAAFLYHMCPAVSSYAQGLKLYSEAAHTLSHVCSSHFQAAGRAEESEFPRLFRHVCFPLQELLLEAYTGVVMCTPPHDIGESTVESIRQIVAAAELIGLKRCMASLMCQAVQACTVTGDNATASNWIADVRGLASGSPVRQFMGGGVRQYMDPSFTDGLEALFVHIFGGSAEGARPLYVRALSGCIGTNFGSAAKVALLDGRSGMPLDVQCLVLEGFANCLRQGTPSLEDVCEALTMLDRRLQLGAAMGDSSVRAQLVTISCLGEVSALLATRFEGDSRAVEIAVAVDDLIEGALKDLLRHHTSSLLPMHKYEIAKKYAMLAYTHSRFDVAAKFFDAAIAFHDSNPADYVLCGYCYSNKTDPSIANASRMYNTAHALVALRHACASEMVAAGMESSGPAGSTTVYSDLNVLAECGKFAWYWLKDAATAEELYKRGFSLASPGDPERPQVLVDYANVRFAAFGDVQGAERLFLEARELQPSSASIQLSYLEFLFSAMRIPELLKQASQTAKMELSADQTKQLQLNVTRAEQMINPEEVGSISGSYHELITGEALSITDTRRIPEEAMLNAISRSSTDAMPLSYIRFLVDRTFALGFALRCVDTLLERHPGCEEGMQFREELLLRALEELDQALTTSEEGAANLHVLSRMDTDGRDGSTVVAQLLEHAALIGRRYPDRPEEAERFLLQAVQMEMADGLGSKARSAYVRWLLAADHLSPARALATLDDMFRGIGVVAEGGESAAEVSLSVVRRVNLSDLNTTDAHFLAFLHTCYAAMLAAVAATLTPFKEGLAPPSTASAASLLLQADHHFQAALLLHENSATVHLEYGNYLMSQRTFERGIYHTQRALELDPTNAGNLVHATTLMINYSITLLNERALAGVGGSLSDPGRIREATSLTSRWCQASLIQCPTNTSLLECISSYEEGLAVYDSSYVAQAKRTAATLRSMRASEGAALRDVRRGIFRME